MEKLVIGVPHEVEITTSIDMGKFNVELCLVGEGYNFHIELQPLDDNKFSILVPKKLEELSNKTLDYKLFVYKDNARFQADDGSLKFISEKDFKVDGKDGKFKTKVELPSDLDKQLKQVDKSDKSDKLESKEAEDKSAKKDTKEIKEPKKEDKKEDTKTVSKKNEGLDSGTSSLASIIEQKAQPPVPVTTTTVTVTPAPASSHVNATQDNSDKPVNRTKELMERKLTKDALNNRVAKLLDELRSKKES